MDAVAKDEQLVEAARAGDRRAFSQLYERYVQMVHAVVLAHTPRSDVADLVQDVFMRALSRLSRLRDAQAFGGWLATIARNCVRDRSRGPAHEPLPEQVAAPAVDSDAAEATDALEAIRTLPDAYRETLLMRLVEGMTGPEIAARTGLTEGSVRVNLHRGLKMLREHLGRPI